MARSEARIFCSIWRNTEFIALSPNAQRAYFLLLSQSDLNYCGVLPLRVRRWAPCSAHTTTDDLVVALGELEEHRFVLIDLDTEELLVRSFIRNDELYKQPQLLTAAERATGEIASTRLREALADDLDRIPVDELSDAPTVRGRDKKPGPSLRAQVTETLDRIRTALRPPAADPAGNPSRTPPEAPAQALGDAGARAHLPSPVSCLPTPHSNSVSDGTGEISTEQDVPTPIEAHAAADIADQTKRLLTAHIGKLHRRPPDRVTGQLATHIRALLVEGFTVAELTAGLTRLRDKNLGPASLATAVNEAAQTPARRPPGPDCPIHQQPTNAHGLCGACRADHLAGHDPPNQASA